MAPGDASRITNLTTLAAALLAVSLALLAVMPTFIEQARRQNTSLDADYYVHAFKIFFWTLFFSVLFLGVAALDGLVGLYWPRALIEWILAALVGAGTATLIAGNIGVAYFVRKSVLR
jgi:cytochrome c biogenesis protein CcdA